MRQLVMELTQVVGQINPLTSPALLLTNLGAGLWSFFYEPSNAAGKSPKEFAVGLYRGTIGLLTSSLTGTAQVATSLMSGVGQVSDGGIAG